jgi:hypothetical protein
MLISGGVERMQESVDDCGQVVVAFMIDVTLALRLDVPGYGFPLGSLGLGTPRRLLRSSGALPALNCHELVQSIEPERSANRNR